MATIRKKTAAERKAQYERIKSTLSDRFRKYDAANEGYDDPNTYEGKLAEGMLNREMKKRRIKNRYGNAGMDAEFNAYRNARNEVNRLSKMADRAYQNMSKAAGGKG